MRNYMFLFLLVLFTSCAVHGGFVADNDKDARTIAEPIMDNILEGMKKIIITAIRKG